MEKIIDVLKRFWNKHFKPHCPECGGIMDHEFTDVIHHVEVFQCRDCEKEWI